MKLLKTNEIDPIKWQQLALESPVASFFQSKACYDFYCSLTFLEPLLLGVEVDNKLVALVCGYVIADGNKIKQFFSCRAIVPGGLLLSSDCSDEAVFFLLIEIKKILKKKAIYIEFRNYSDYSKFKYGISKAGFSYQQHLNFQLNVTQYDNLLSKISKSKVRQIKQTEKTGVLYEEVKNDTDILLFYKQLKTIYDSKIHRPLFPVEFFFKIANQNFSKFFVLKLNNEIIGGIICVFDNKKVYEWFVCGDDTENSGSYPSVIATWAGIKFASESGFEVFDFMGAGKPNEKYGVRDFKAKFGGELVEHGRFLYICNQLLFTLGKMAIKLKR